MKSDVSYNFKIFNNSKFIHLFCSVLCRDAQYISVNTRFYYYYYLSVSVNFGYILTNNDYLFVQINLLFYLN